MRSKTAPNYPISARETAGQTVRMSALLAAPVGVHPANSADNDDDLDDLVVSDAPYYDLPTVGVTRDQSARDYPIATSWADYDRMLELFDADPDRYPEPQAPWANLSYEALDGASERTERRRRAMRKSEIQALLARDGRRSVDKAAALIRSRRNADDDHWMTVCEFCAHPFESVRDNARFCSDRCRKASHRKEIPA
jgi:hypothetical protein